MWITEHCGGRECQTTLLASWDTYIQVKKQQLELDVE